MNHQIKLSVPDFLSETEVNELTSDINKVSPPFVERTHPEAWAAMEWLMPTALIALVTKPYFEAFLSEAGKDHYAILKSWLKKLAIYSRKKFNYKTVASTGSEEKLSKTYTQSSAISVFLELSDGRRIKLLFDLKLTQEVWENSIDKILIVLEDHYHNHPNDLLSKELSSKKGKIIYGIIDEITLSWIFLDDPSLLDRIKNRS